MTRSRQLAAIMFTDIQGYTALMQHNEAKAIQAREKHRRIFNSTTAKYNGRILQYYGDGTLSIFDSAVEAVNCGIEMQLGFQKDPAIPVRIGIHTGDIVFSDEEIIGDGVNVASRIESLAVPGSIFVSDKVYDEIKNQESIKTSMLKTFKLKNVEKPMEVYAISNVGLIVPKSEEIEGIGDIDPGPDTVGEKPSLERERLQPVLATKLFIPQPRPKAVQRRRLVDRLNEGRTGKLTLISAPPGFGKTTLVCEWVAGHAWPTAWISLDLGDNDPTKFLQYLVSAIRTIAPNLGEGALSMLFSPQPPPAESILTTLLNEISAIQDPFILVLDDYHVIDSRQVDDAVAFMLEHLPPRMHLAITSREDPKLPLARLRVRGQLTELRAGDLRFTSTEATEFLTQVMEMNLSAKNIKTLEASTEGWVAGLQLAALSMQGREDIDGFISTFAGDDRHVADYLVEEVLQGQPEHVRSFLMRSSVLDRLCGPLCEAVTGQGGGRAMLESLDRANLFVVPLDDRRQWYRYHHLFAEVLQTRAREVYPDLIPELHRRASDWYEKNNLPADAIRHALAAGDFERSGGMIELAWPAMDKNCQVATWLGWARALPEKLVAQRPVLCVGYAWALLQWGQMEDGEAWLNIAEDWLDRMRNEGGKRDQYPAGMLVVDQEQFGTLPASIANARAYHAQVFGDGPGTLKYARQALDLLPEDEYIKRGISAVLMGFVQWQDGELEAAYHSFSDVRSSFQKAGEISTAIGITFILSDIRIAQGRIREAAGIFKKSLQLALAQGEPMPFGTEDLYRGLSEIYLEMGETETARAYLLKAEQLSEQTRLTDWRYRRCLARASLKEAEGDLDAALDLLDKAEELYFRSPLPDIRPVAALRVRLWIKQGQWDKALGWAEERGLSEDDEPDYVHEFEYLTLVRLRIGMYRDQKEVSISRTQELLERLLEAAERGERKESLIGILVLQALAFEVQGDTANGLVPLERALTLAETEGYFRIFAGEGHPMARLLSAAATRDIMPAYTARLLTALEALQKNGE